MNGIHYHNSVKNSNSEQMYVPSSAIITEPLTTKYTVGENIGRGKFAVVKKCANNETHEEVAAKFIKKRRRGKTCREEILREVVMLEMALDHPRLVDLKEVYETQSELILITEYCAGGELFTECVLEESFNEADVRLLMSQILEGLVYLHEKNIVHLDLKPQNILLTQQFPKGTVKICDLGFACLVNTGEDIRDIIGTPDYVAPEVLNYDPLGLYTDMWSLGVLTYVMLTTYSPFAGNDKTETFCNITAVKLDFPEELFQDISGAAQDFIKKLLIAEPKERLTAKQCQDHPWITGDVGPSRMLTSPHPEQGKLSTSEDEELESSIEESDKEPEQITKEPIRDEELTSEPIRNIVVCSDDQDKVKSAEIVNDSDSGMVNDSNSVSPVETMKNLVPNASVSTSDLSLHECDRGTDVELTSDRESNPDLDDTEMYKTAPKLHHEEERRPDPQELQMSSEDVHMESELYKESEIIMNEDAEMKFGVHATASADPRVITDVNLHGENTNLSVSSPSIIIECKDTEHEDTEMTSKSSTEEELRRPIGDFNQNSVAKDNKGANPSENLHIQHICESQSIDDIPSKRVKCETLNSSLSSEGAADEEYEYVSVSNRIRIFENSFKETNEWSPGKSPGKSPKSPRISRHSPRFTRRSSKPS